MKPSFVAGPPPHQIRLKTFRVSAGSPQLSDVVVHDGDDQVFDEDYESRSRRRRRDMVLDDDDEDRGRSSRPSRPRLESDEQSHYDEEYYAPLPDDFCAPEVKRVSI